MNLGLIPSSEESWPVACQVLNPTTGGILHIHMNVDSTKNTWTHDCTKPNGYGNCSDKNVSHSAENNSDEERKMLHSSPVLSNPNKDRDYSDSLTKQPLEIKLKSEDKFVKKVKLKSEWQMWAIETREKIKELLQTAHGKSWLLNILHIEHVKSYAPHVDHVVLDLECRPVEQY